MIDETYQRFVSLTGDPVAAALLTLAETISGQRPDNASLNVKDAAKILGISADKIYDLCREGKLRHKRIGRAVRIHPADLEEFQRDTTRAPSPTKLRCLRA